MIKQSAYSNIATAYKNVLERLLFNPDHVVNVRGSTVSELLNINFLFSSEINNLFVPFFNNKRRSSQLKYIAAELLWNIAGDNSLKFIEPYAKFWSSIANEDLTCNSAYGYLMLNSERKDQNYSKKSQLQYVVDELKRDQFSRRAVAFYNTPTYQEKPPNLDFPCTIYANYLIRKNKLHTFVRMRSQDAILGFPTDVPVFVMFHYIVFAKLKLTYPDIQIGDFCLSVDSFHLYEKHLNLAREMVMNDFLEEKHYPFGENTNDIFKSINELLNDDMTPTSICKNIFNNIKSGSNITKNVTNNPFILFINNYLAV